jgi:hypothetical protein
MKRLIYVGSGIAGVIAAAIFASGSLINSGIAQPQVGSKEFVAAWDASEKIAIERSKASPEIQKYTSGAIAVDRTFYPAALIEDNTDRMYITVFKAREVVGDWKTAYVVTYTGHVEITANFAGDRITKVSATQAPDENFTIAYSEEKKSLINLVLQDPTLQKLLDGKDWYVRHIHTTLGSSAECPNSECNSVIIDQADRQESVDVLVNLATGKILHVRSTPGW